MPECKLDMRLEKDSEIIAFFHRKQDIQGWSVGPGKIFHPEILIYGPI